MSKAGSKGRGRGRGRGSVAGRGGGESGAAPGRSDSASSFSREQSLMRSFVGGRRRQLLGEQEIEAVLGMMAAAASTSIASSSSQMQSTDSARVSAEQRSASAAPPAKLPRQLEGPVQEPSVLLFDDSVVLGSGGQGGSPVHTVSRAEHASDDDDETQIPSLDACSNPQPLQEEQLPEVLEEGPTDDEILDPSWCEGQQSGGSRSEEEIAPAVQQQRAQKGSRVRGESQLPVASTSAPARSRTDANPSARGAPKRCGAWAFFDQVADDLTKVKCNLCHLILKRGKNVHNLNTTNMLRHLRNKHLAEWTSQTTNLVPPAAPSDTSSANVGASSSQERQGTTSRMTVQAASVTATQPPRSQTQSSSQSQGSLQPSVPQLWDRRKKFPATHQRAQALNAGITKLLALEMLAFRLVDTDAFRNLMALAVPQYCVPSRHYFSRQAVPALQEHVERKIKRALLNSISSKVHLTTDAWTSKHGQGRYVSLTAHWVNVVEPGTEGASGTAQVLPTPRIAGLSSVRIASSCYSSSSDSSAQQLAASASARIPKPSSDTTRFSTAVAKRQQAVLKLISLGDRSHTAEQLWNAIKQQSDQWFSPLNLQPGLVVCDNGRNLVAALGLGNLTHIPCLAHVLNLVVQSFLKNYPELEDLLHKVRGECAHLRRSSVHSGRLAALQRRFQLPEHRLICDVRTRWNSTLHMLERLCEQQQAVMELQLQQAQTSRAPRRPHFTCSEWAFMKDICSVLRPFHDSTLMSSADDAIVSMTVPLLCILEKTLLGIRDAVLDQEEEEEQMMTMASGLGQSSQSSTGGLLAREHGTSQRSRQGTLLEAEEEEELEEEVVWAEEGGRPQTGSQHLQRGWGDTEETESMVEAGDSGTWPVGSLQHMSNFMLQCFRNDTRIARILRTNDYWVASLLDPRYRDNLPTLLSPLIRDSKMRDYQEALIHSMLASFPPTSSIFQGSSVPESRAVSRPQSRSSTSSAEGNLSMSKMWQSFVGTTPRPAPSHPATFSRRQRYRQMVTDYMSTHVSVSQDGSAPFKFWVSKLEIWPELSQYALEVLACPAASVLSERVFSAAGGVLTDQRTRLSSDNVDRLTFIKMNQGWISPDFASPVPDETQ